MQVSENCIQGPIRGSRRIRPRNLIMMASLTEPGVAATRMASPVKLHMSTEQTYVPVREVGRLFDPLGLADEATLVPAREAELKHGRLAMLAAVAVPIQEMIHPALVEAGGSIGAPVHSLLIDGKSPSFLNGGLAQPEVLPALLATLVLGSVLEIKDLKDKRSWGIDAVIGFMLGDELRPRQPQSVLPVANDDYVQLPLQTKLRIMEAELLNGRLAMMAVAAYVVQEDIFQMPVVANLH